MIAGAMLAGAGLGLGLLLVARGLLAGPPPLAAALAELHAPAPPATGTSGGWQQALATRARDLLHTLGIDPGHLDSDLRVMERTLERHVLDKLAASTAGLALPPVLALLATLGGLAPPLVLTVAGAVGLAAGGFFLPDLLLRGQATERRRAFRFALSSYLDLAHIASTAAGLGIQLVTVWQDRAQITARYGTAAPTVMNNHRAKLILSGIADPTTTGDIAQTIGETEVVRQSRSIDADGRTTATEAAQTRLLASAAGLRQLQPFEGILVYGHLPPTRVRLRPWFEANRRR